MPSATDVEMDRDPAMERLNREPSSVQERATVQVSTKRTLTENREGSSKASQKVAFPAWKQTLGMGGGGGGIPGAWSTGSEG